ncbi:Bacteriocin-protection, YdeI or OmpD-Associated [Modestobacter sp. DSM 44400]|uniref:YdeI/OmpD-associated family protein n=1 Tax=Modestobacter sp. DSM 44400 TaxID=1550230 RepID=UPI00089D74ED|nr:YdeI/OmpD-associated family protein [Modestobacter sp. DSM 44400]SDX47154.1 Bacteriocin-protection, YdeI or OmpD-Associated [Modestobacter sp. DSM 44400]
MRFSTTVELGGKTATGMEVPPEIVEALGAGKKPAVRVTVGGHTYRSTIASMGGRFLLPLSAERRAAAGVAAGDRVEVDVQLDTEPRTVEVPADLAAALDAEPAARARFDALAYSHQLRHVLGVDGAKAETTRARRVAGVVSGLLDG